MVFYKAFPRYTDKSNYPVWDEVKLTDAEEKEQEAIVRKKNIELIKECIEDASEIMEQKDLKRFQTDMINLAIALFEKRASHQVYHKEREAKKKFKKKFPS